MLAACNDAPGFAPGMTLPPLPAGTATCLKGAGVPIPARNLTVAEVEALWKQDRYRIAAMRQCGSRLVAFYSALRKSPTR